MKGRSAGSQGRRLWRLLAWSLAWVLLTNVAAEVFAVYCWQPFTRPRETARLTAAWDRFSGLSGDLGRFFPDRVRSFTLCRSGGGGTAPGTEDLCLESGPKGAFQRICGFLSACRSCPLPARDSDLGDESPGMHDAQSGALLADLCLAIRRSSGFLRRAGVLSRRWKGEST